MTSIAPASNIAACRTTPEAWRITREDGIVFISAARAGEPRPDDWKPILRACLDRLPRGSVVGAKRLTADGHIFSMGEFIVHPKGFHHHGRGVHESCYRFPEEVDALAGGVMALDEPTFDLAGGEATLIGALGGLALGLEARRCGGRCFAVPQVVVHDETTPAPNEMEADAFREQFGIDWRSPDLDAAHREHAGTGLLWNARFHAPAMPFAKYEERGPLVWTSYEQAECFRQRAHALVSVVRRFHRDGLVLDLGCGDGFFSHLMAMDGLEVLGLEPEARGIEQCLHMTRDQRYPGPRPRFRQGGGDAIPLDDGGAATVTLFDVIEHLPHPGAVLRETARVLRSGGCLVVVTPAWQYGGSSDPVYHGFEYTMEELAGQVGATPGLRIIDSGRITGVYRDLIVVAQKHE